MSGWTPGPWRASPGTGFIHGPDGSEIGSINLWWDSRSGYLSNERLVAAAPELYEALEDLAMRADGHDMDTLRAKAVLAKARGDDQ